MSAAHFPSFLLSLTVSGGHCGKLLVTSNGQRLLSIISTCKSSHPSLEPRWRHPAVWALESVCFCLGTWLKCQLDTLCDAFFFFTVWCFSIRILIIWGMTFINTFLPDHTMCSFWGLKISRLSCSAGEPDHEFLFPEVFVVQSWQFVSMFSE